MKVRFLPRARRLTASLCWRRIRRQPAIMRQFVRGGLTGSCPLAGRPSVPKPYAVSTWTYDTPFHLPGLARGSARTSARACQKLRVNLRPQSQIGPQFPATGSQSPPSALLGGRRKWYDSCLLRCSASWGVGALPEQVSPDRRLLQAQVFVCVPRTGYARRWGVLGRRHGIESGRPREVPRESSGNPPKPADGRMGAVRPLGAVVPLVPIRFEARRGRRTRLLDIRAGYAPPFGFDRARRGGPPAPCPLGRAPGLLGAPASQAPDRVRCGRGWTLCSSAGPTKSMRTLTGGEPWR